MQWLLRQYHLSDAPAEALAEAFAEHDYHDFTLSTHVVGGQELTCYGRDGQLPAAVEQLLQKHSLVTQSVVDEGELLKPYDPQQPVWLRDDVALITDDMPAPSQADICIPLRSGPAFGDGRHPTTRIAARMMQPVPWPGLRTIDVGAGSGVLGILAQRCGARLCALTDIDADSVRSCRDNLQRNACAPELAVQADLLQGLDMPPVDVIIANIYAELLEDLLASPDFQRLLPRGWLILSGISHHKYASLCQHLEQQGLRIVAEAEEAWWHAICAQRGFDAASDNR